MKKSLAIALRCLPWGILLLAGAAVWQEGREGPPPPPPPELPPELRLAPPSPPPRAAAPAPPAGAALEGTLRLPETIPLGEALEAELEVVNTGKVPLTGLVLLLPLPEGVRTPALASSLRLTVPTLAPGESAGRSGRIVATRPGPLALRAHFRSAEGVTTRADAQVGILTAVLGLDEPVISRKADGSRQLCLRVTNHGDAPARDLVVRLLAPGAATPRVLWTSLEAGDGRVACLPLPSLEARLPTLLVEVSARAADVARREIPLPSP
jgi:hypothetical protein